MSIIFLFFLAFSESKIPSCEPIYSFWQNHKAELGSQTSETVLAPENKIGAGAFGSVYIMQWNGKPAIIKVNVLKSPSNWASFSKEVFVLSKLEGINGVVKFHGCIESVLSVSIVMEKLHQDLLDLIPTIAKLDLGHRMMIYFRLAKIFKTIHQRGVYHNDIKPENLMSASETTIDIRVIDFGLSCLQGQRCTGGTPIFNSPEKVRMLSQANLYGSEKIDVWAFSLTLAVFESGQYFGVMNKDIDPGCFRENMDTNCYDLLIKNVNKMLAATIKPFAKFILRGLSYDPEKRPTMEEYMKAISEVRTNLFFLANPNMHSSTLLAWKMSLAQLKIEPAPTFTQKIKDFSKRLWHRLFATDRTERPNPLLSM